MSEWNSDVELEKLRAEFPGWEIYKGVSMLWYARLPGSPQILVRGEDLTDLRDEIIRALHRHQG